MIYLSLISLGSETTVATVVERQLADYCYMFLLTQVCFHFSALCNSKFCQGDPLKALPQHTCPYCNPQIISVIKELYFGPGTSSYAYRFEEYVGSSLFDTTGLH